MASRALFVAFVLLISGVPGLFAKKASSQAAPLSAGTAVRPHPGGSATAGRGGAKAPPEAWAQDESDVTNSRRLSHPTTSTPTWWTSGTSSSGWGSSERNIEITLEAYDSYGDGWNGDYISLYHVDPQLSSSSGWDYTYAGSCCSDTFERTSFNVSGGTCYLIEQSIEGNYSYESSYTLDQCGIYNRAMSEQTYICVDMEGQCSDASENWDTYLAYIISTGPNGTVAAAGENVTVKVGCGAYDVLHIFLVRNSSTSTDVVLASDQELGEVQCPLNQDLVTLQVQLPYVNTSGGYYGEFVSTWYNRDTVYSNSFFIESTCIAGAGEYCLEDDASTVVPCNWLSDIQDVWYYCPNGTYRGLCPQGYYCGESYNQTEPSACPEGYYCPDEGMGIGYYCDAGTVCPGTGNTEAALCTEGYYCPGGAEETICSIDNYCPEGSSTMKSCNNTWPLLYVCPKSGLSEPFNCSSKTKNDVDEYGNLLCYKEDSLDVVTTECYYDEATYDSTDPTNIDFICSCNPSNLYSGTYCETKQSTTTSYIFGGIAMGLAILLMITCLVCDGVWIVAGALDKRYVNPLVIQIRENTVKQKAKMKANELEKGQSREKLTNAMTHAVGAAIDNVEDIAANTSDPSAIQDNATYIQENAENMSGSRGAIHKFYKAHVKHIFDNLEPWKWFKCLLTAFSILFGSACADIAKMIANVFLIVKGLTTAIPNFDTERMDEIIDSFRGFLENVHPNLTWVADVYEWFISLFANFDIATITMDSLQVTCEGSQAPSRLFANVLVVLLVVIIFEAHVFPFVNISIQAASRLIKNFQEKRKYPMLLVAVATNLARLVEFIFKYIIQLLQGVTAVSAFLPIHDRTLVCGNVDNVYRYVATLLFYVLMFVTGTVLLRTFVWGKPKDVEFRSADGYLPNWFKTMCCYNETSQRYHLSSKNEKDEVPSLADILVMICVDAKKKEITTLKNFIKAMLWKIFMLLKMTFGIWDKELAKNMKIAEMSKRYDDDPNDDKEYHQDMICLIGQSHCLVWQFAPALVSISKFMEASHFAPVYATKSGKYELKVDPFLTDKKLCWWKGESIFQKVKSLSKKLKSFVDSRFFVWFVNVTKFIFVLLLALVPKSTWIAISTMISFPMYISGTIEKLIELGFLK